MDSAVAMVGTITVMLRGLREGEPAMTDETTARDRAIEAVADEFAPYGGGTSEAEIAVDALLASPKLLRALAGAPTATEWGARWTDGGYCPSSPRRSEEFARKHARNFGTRPIRREVGPWVYADTSEPAFPDQPEESTR